MAIQNNITNIRGARSVEADMTVEEFKEWLMCFDADKDGRISRHELQIAIRSFQGWRKGWTKGRRGIKYADADGNGFIDAGEIDKLVQFAREHLGLKIRDNYIPAKKF